MDRCRIAGQIAEVGPRLRAGLRHAADEELPRADGEFECVIGAGELIPIEKAEASEPRCDRVRTVAGVEEGGRLDFEVVAPAGLGERGAAECSEAVDVPAELAVCLLSV